MTRVGILALQGDVREHARVIDRIGAERSLIRRPSELDGIDALIIPGGESTTIGRLATIYGLMDPLREFLVAGLPTFGTCAGMIFLAEGVTDGAQPQLGVIDMIVERNAFGRQNESFEADLDVRGLDTEFRAVFIRAPWVAKVGGSVDVLATVDHHPVMVRQGNVFATSFHPELTDDPRIHKMVLDVVEGRSTSDGER